MKKVSIYFISFFLLFQTTQLQAYSTNPKDFINELVNEAISKLSNKNLDKSQKANFIEQWL